MLVTAAGAVAGRVSGPIFAAGLLASVGLAAAGQLADRISRGTGSRRNETSKDGRGSDRTIPVRRFRVKTTEGDAVAYVLKGLISDDALRPGEIVRLRRGRSRVRELDVLVTLNGPVIRHLRARLSAASVMNQVCLVAAGLVGAGAVILGAVLLT
jgi:hypothetical protein